MNRNKARHEIPAVRRGDLVTEMAALRHAGPGDLYPATPWPDGGPAAGSADGGCRVWVRVDGLHCLVKTCPCPATMYGRARAIGVDSCRVGSAAFGDRKECVG